MKYFELLIIAALFSNITAPAYSQDSSNCFLIDFEPKNAGIPPFEDEEKPAADPNVIVTVNTADTLGKISKYIFGNALAVWIGNTINDPVLIDYLQKLAPTLIRYPGGNWSSIFFWNGNPGNLPDSIVDGSTGQKTLFTPQYGKNSWPTTLDNYYTLREQVNTQGLITVNYSYARYGLGPEPVKQAAHYAADWVRYDYGRTLFWEIGNEDGGPWQAGWRIDTTLNEDGQPEIITGELYGKHFKIFADSMRAAANEVGSAIYIGGQVLHYNGTGSWNIADRQWNEGFFREVGDAADFYVFHNYFGSAGTVSNLLSAATVDPNSNINFIRQDIINKGASPKPIALTEWNIRWDLTANNLHRTSVINGMQAVIILSELIKLKCGMSARWLIANWESDGMFYRGSNSSIPVWNPRPDVFYIYYMQKFTGDNAMAASSDNAGILAYATRFSSGETGMVVVNKGADEQVIRVNMPGQNVGEKFYIYSLTGGTDNGDFSQNVYVNGTGPTAPAWGPIEDLETLPASAYTISGEIKFTSPARSVQFILIENGNNPLSVNQVSGLMNEFALYQNYPNPFNPITSFNFHIAYDGFVTLKVYDVLGNEVATVVNEELPAGNYKYRWDASSLASGCYFYKLRSGNFADIKKLILLK